MALTSQFGSTSIIMRPGETKIFYYIDGDERPFLCTLKIPIEQVTLADFKRAIDRPNTYLYFIKAYDVELGEFKQPVTEDGARLEPYKGRIVAWLQPKVIPDNSNNRSDPGSHDSDSNRSYKALLPARKSLDPPLRNARDFSSYGDRQHSTLSKGAASYASSGGASEQTNRGFETDSMMSYDPNQKCSYSDSEFDGSSRASTITADLASLPRNDRNRRRKFTKQRSCLVRASSASSVADTVFSGNQNTTIVRLNREHGGTLGIRAIEYQGEIYVESILKGCVVDLDKRIQPGDIILQVNNHHLTGMTSEEATGLLRELTKKPGPICLKVIKMEPSPQSTRSSNIGVPMLPNSYYNQPLMLQSIASPDLNARVAPWVAYTEAMRSTASIAPTSLYSEDLQHPRYSLEDVGQRAPLSLDTNILTVVRRMAARDSGLEVKNRMWLKIEIKNAFMGRNLVKWIKDNVEGLSNAKDAKRYASRLLQDGYIRQTMGTTDFSEKAYYNFDIPVEVEDTTYMVNDNLVNHDDMDDIPDSVSQVANNQYNFSYAPSILASTPITRRANGSGHSSGGSANSSERRQRSTIYEETSSQLTQLQIPQYQARGLINTPHEVLASRQSFKMAMGKY